MTWSILICTINILSSPVNNLLFTGELTESFYLVPKKYCGMFLLIENLDTLIRKIKDLKWTEDVDLNLAKKGLFNFGFRQKKFLLSNLKFRDSIFKSRILRDLNFESRILVKYSQVLNLKLLAEKFRSFESYMNTWEYNMYRYVV